MDEREISRLTARDERKREDILKGLSRAKGAQRGDFKLCREIDKNLADYRRYKDPEDRKKIQKEYFAIQDSYEGKGDR